MMQKLEVLLDVLIGAGAEVRDYYAGLNRESSPPPAVSAVVVPVPVSAPIPPHRRESNPEPQSEPQLEPQAPPKVKRHRRTKAEIAADKAEEESRRACLAIATAPASPAIVAEFKENLTTNAAAAATPVVPEMSEEESSKRLTDLLKILIQRFSNPVPSAKEGEEPAPEGFVMAKEILAEKFKVARRADLTHPQRLEFITIIEDLLAKKDDKKAVPTPAPAQEALGV